VVSNANLKRIEAPRPKRLDYALYIVPSAFARKREKPCWRRARAKS
jgi:hypothetical protein